MNTQNATESTNKFSLRTTPDKAAAIRLAYSEYRSREQIVDPSKTAPSMNMFLTEAVLRFIEELNER